MRIPLTLSKYLCGEILIYTALSFLALTTILVSQNALGQLDELVSFGVTFSDFLAVLGCLLPMLSAYTLPMAFLFGVFFAVSRMSADGEILAMTASGLGVASLLLPALVVGAVASGATAYVMISVEHRAHRELRTLVETVAARGGMLEAGRFRGFGGRTLFVDERDRENRLRGVMISDQTNPKRPFIIFAERGHFAFDEERALFRLGLDDGTIHLGGTHAEEDRSERLSFESLEYSFDVNSLIGSLSAAVRPRQMDSSELRSVVERARAGGGFDGLDQWDPIEYELEGHRRYALPMAPLLFAAMAVPLGVGRAGRSRLRGALMSLILAFGYYSLLSLSRFIAKEGWLSAGWALWLPNIVFGLVALLLIMRARHGGRR